jgi:hypothetical protein
MCQRIQCKVCKKPSFAGCGAHVEQVLGDVPASERCKCRDEAAEGASPNRSSWIDRLLRG